MVKNTLLLFACCIFALSIPWLVPDSLAATFNAWKNDYILFVGVGAMAFVAAVASAKVLSRARAHARLRLQRSLLSQGSTSCDAPGMVGFGSIHARC